MMHLQGKDVEAILLSAQHKGVQVWMRPHANVQVGAFELLIQIAELKDRSCTEDFLNINIDMDHANEERWVLANCPSSCRMVPRYFNVLLQL
jgi:hypothetical protein